MPVRHTLAALGLFAGALTATPALAGEGEGHVEHRALPPLPDAENHGPSPVASYRAEDREDWLAECEEMAQVMDSDEAADFCEDYLDRRESAYLNAYSYAYGAGGHDLGMKHGGHYGGAYYGGRVMWVPVKISGGCKPKCGCKTERVVEEWVDEPAPPARRVVPTKRVPIKATKTVPLKPTKYTK